MVFFGPTRLRVELEIRHPDDISDWPVQAMQKDHGLTRPEGWLSLAANLR